MFCLPIEAISITCISVKSEAERVRDSVEQTAEKTAISRRLAFGENSPLVIKIIDDQMALEITHLIDKLLRQ